MKRVLVTLLAITFGLTPLGLRAEDTEGASAPQQPEIVAVEEAEFVPVEEFSRQMPGREAVPFPTDIYESVPSIDSSASGFVSIPDRWRMLYAGKWYDPYNQNVLKGDIPVFGEPGHEWFTELSIVSDTLLEARRIAVPVGFATTKHPNSNDTFGNGDQSIFVQNVLLSFGLIRGDTTFKPPEYELRITPIFNTNYVKGDENGVLRADPSRGDSRTDDHAGFQELFADVHLANLSERYDFVSTRLGIQQFVSDFRGFIYNDNEPGARIFGNYDNNKTQFNAAWFSRLEKDANSGINTTFIDRHEDVFVANVYRQDLLALGHTTTFNVLHREDRAGDQGFHYDDNGFLVRPTAIGDTRPKNISATYFGTGGDGHIGRLNTTTMLYYVTGSESHNAIANRQVDISAGMAAQEFSVDIDWLRIRTSAFWSSGDKDPFDGKATGFDTVFDNPNFAGGDLSYWQRQGLPFIGGGATNFTNRNSLIPDFRAGKEQGQSNYVNPGLRLYNVGLDAELLPELKLINNVSYLQFDQTEAIEAVRQDGSISRQIGWDLSSGILYRPFLNNNVQIRAGVACLLPGQGTKNLFGDDVLYTAFGNLILQY